ncbi:MAG TPA: SBBP repeat-containing protein, partial [Thermoanaerobaculia bacterium]|nr:SBBP repeat-containing protein [Thermoanaerobaculia bacterium]
MRRLLNPSILGIVLLAPAAVFAGPVSRPSYGKLPVAFESNEGQTDPAVRYLARSGVLTAFLTQDGVTLRVADGRAAANVLVFRLTFAGAATATGIEALEALPGKVNYLDLTHPLAGRSGVPLYARVRYRDVFPGIDLDFYGRGGVLEHDFIVAPGADPRAIALDVDGADVLETDRSGNLVLCTSNGEMTLSAPVLYQEGPRGRVEVDGRFVLRGERRVGFDVAAYDRTRPLVIDPSFLYSTYLGGNADDTGEGIAIDASGNAYVAGSTTSTNFPTTVGSVQPNDLDAAGTDAYVTKLNPTGTALVYSTYIGAAGTQLVHDIAVDSTGRAFIAGFSDASDVDGDAFVIRLNAAGNSTLLANGGYVKVFGGTFADEAFGVALDAAGNAYVTGQTLSTDFPTTAGAYKTAFAGENSVAFFARIDTSGNISYSSMLSISTSSENQGTAIAVDASNAVYVVGYYFFYCGSCTPHGDALVARFT